MLPVSAVTSQLMGHRRRLRWAMYPGWLCVITGAVHLTLLDEKTSDFHTVLILALLGVGCGLTLSSINFAVQVIPTPERASSAATTYTFLRSLGMCLGVAVGSNIFQNAVTRKVTSLGLDRSIVEQILEPSALNSSTNTSSSPADGLIRVFCYGLHVVYWVVAGFSVLGLACAAFIREPQTEKKPQLLQAKTK